jgi:hypothetical protein
VGVDRVALRGAGDALLHLGDYRAFRRLGVRRLHDVGVLSRVAPGGWWLRRGWTAAEIRQVLDGCDETDLRRFAKPWFDVAQLLRIDAVDGSHRLLGLWLTRIVRYGTGPAAALMTEYLTSPHAALFAARYGWGYIIGLVDNWVPYPVFVELVEAFRGRPEVELHGAAGACALARRFAADVQRGSIGWAELPGWVRWDAAGALRVVRHRPHQYPVDPASEAVRERWARWHAAYLDLGPDAPHPALWDGAGFGPAEATALWRRGEAPDLATLEMMAALRREA